MRSKSCKANKQSRLMKVICSPIRILIKARDLYMKSIQDCSGRVGLGGAVLCPSPGSASRLPQNYSVNASKGNDNEEFRQLLRSVSKRGTDIMAQQKMQQLSRMKQTTVGSAGGIMGMRSYSVGVGKLGRIDEHKPCSFEEEWY